MAKDELIDDRVSLNQCQKAVDALHAYVSEVAAKKAETQLLPDVEQAFWLTIALKKQPQGSSLKVYSIPIAHPIVDPRKESVCLFTKDPQRTYKDLLADNNIRFISKVIDISKLKGKYKAFDARRALLKEHGLFLADDRVIPLLPKLLGSKFFRAKKQPLPVNITRKNLKTELERAVSSTYMPSIRGSTLSVRVGKISQTAAQVVANIKTALPVIASKINGGWDNVQSIGLKTSMSAYLPIWTCSLDDSKDGRWASLAADDEEESEFEGDEDEEDEDEDEEEDGVDDVEDVGMIGDDEESDSSGIVQKIKATGKKRAADLDGDNDADETPKKKKSKKSSDVLKTVDVPPKSQKSKSIASAPAKQKFAPVSTTEDASTSKVTGPKTSSAHDLPATKKAPAPAEKPSTQQKSAKTTDIKDTIQPPDSSAPKKQKGEKKEKKSATATTSKSISEITSTPAEPVPAPAKKTKKSDAAAPEAASPTATSAPTTNKTTEKKAKKDGSAVVAAEEKSVSKKEKKKKDLASPENVPQEISTVDSDEKSKKKKEKKSKSSDADDGMAAVVVAEEEHSQEKKKQKKEKKASDANAATLEGDDAMDIDAEYVSGKKAKKTKVAQEEGSAAYSLSNDDLKQKKSKAPGEKKKSKVVKSDSKGKKKWVIPGLF
ncbi:ribosomal protein L1p/L10e family-domain-containing protein [Lentinula raphanica]|uniref:Ribosomal L1 domain-containing protein 1 n=1 Tax=Lentinula raphanica TaxID=153919 RepID=A0AA38PLB3_9AGAR|nr:ribosomal protein L1p/L10e family-domain-containing protein [Lentinula raphanica]KAJ3844999.1 ribosomal protein L1p/L10e family-domain-containing protein [Lentinula raphanica]KAJ3973593.1 ribosomal protein L1p/L10e family-domain-containing protein [Lentinula raphanica]